MRCRLTPLLFIAASSLLGAAWADDASSLRLVPFPKEVRLEAGRFALDRPLIVQATADQATLLKDHIAAELTRAGFSAPRLEISREKGDRVRVAAAVGPYATLALREKPTSEDYTLRVGPDAVDVAAAEPAGLFHGVQTVCQLIRANRRDNALPCLTIRDWPALRWRCLQNDLTRGPSAKLDTLKQQISLGAYLKLNMFTYYMEYQYAFRKHPLIGPPDGSLTPDELKAIVDYGRTCHTEILGNQQSFGHFARILAHDAYAALRETPSVLSPVNEASYRLLDDLYSEICPLLPFAMFNVCCDETWGLGTGPSKELAEKIGVGGVYVQHLRRVHDLLKDKYGKRMMMWGDIILQHPDKLDQIPKDTVMLTWGYGAKPSFENQIIPFAKSGYEFFVCPGVSDWSRIVPDFSTATTNIRNFVRDGVKHGALGMLNTEWKDDGESLNAVNWHGYAWGAECAWTGSTTEPADFNRRLGAVLLGEPSDHFGQAIERLAETHRIPGMLNMNNRRFWQREIPVQRTAATIERSSRSLLELVEPALEHLLQCRKQARLNGELLDSLIHGARRMQLIAQRDLDALAAAQLYTEAWDLPAGQAAAKIDKIEQLVRRNRDAHETLGREFARLWLDENKPYALDWTTKRYEERTAWYDSLLKRLAEARRTAAAGRSLPAPESLGLALGQLGRRTRPVRVDAPLDPQSPWEVAASHRIGLLVAAGPSDRYDLPVEVELPVASKLAKGPVRAFCALPKAASREIPAQLDQEASSGRPCLTFMIPGLLPKKTQAAVRVYLGLTEPAPTLPGAVSTADAPQDKKWIENDQVRLLLGPEGGHVYRWEVKALGSRDLTMPGETGWAGFSDIGSGHRDTPHKLVCTARGPALVRYQCTDPTGLIKTVSLFAGARWMEVILNDPVERYWDFDDPRNFAADGPTPGQYLFSSGATGRVGRRADGVPAQVKCRGAVWSIKWNDSRLALGLATPGGPSQHVIAPGAGAGGVGIENSPASAHFVTFAGLLETDASTTMRRLSQTLDLRQLPEVTMHATQSK